LDPKITKLADDSFRPQKADLYRNLDQALARQIQDHTRRGLLNSTVWLNARREVRQEFLRMILQERITSVIQAHEAAGRSIDATARGFIISEINALCSEWDSTEDRKTIERLCPLRQSDLALYWDSIKADMASESERAGTMIDGVLSRSELSAQRAERAAALGQERERDELIGRTDVPAQGDRPWWLLYWPRSLLGRIAVLCACAVFALASVYAVARVQNWADSEPESPDVDASTRKLELRVQEFAPGFTFKELRSSIVEAKTAHAAVAALMATVSRIDGDDDELSEEEERERESLVDLVIARVFGTGLRVGPYLVDTQSVVPVGSLFAELGGPVPGALLADDYCKQANPTGDLELACVERVTGARVRVRGAADFLHAHASRQGVLVTGLFAGGGGAREALYMTISDPELK